MPLSLEPETTLLISTLALELSTMMPASLSLTLLASMWLPCDPNSTRKAASETLKIVLPMIVLLLAPVSSSP